jgi:hypothetical protein
MFAGVAFLSAIFITGFVFLSAICIAGLLIVNRNLRLVRSRLDQLARQYANRVFLLNLNRVQPDQIVPPTSAPSIVPDPNPGSAQTEILRRRIRLVGIEGAVQSEHPSTSPPLSGREPRRYQ